MATDFQPLSNITPVIDQLSSAETLNIAGVSSPATIHISNWQHMLEGDLVELILDGDENNPLDTQNVVQDGEFLYSIKKFNIPLLKFPLGDRFIYYKVTTKNTVGLPDSVVGRSNKLKFKVINDTSNVDLKIDITEGAAGFNDIYSDLLPANIAVIRGKPNTQWQARGQGKVQIYEAYGADNTEFTLDENGICSLTLIKVDHLDMGSASVMLPGNALYITSTKDKKPLVSADVKFGEYHDVPEDAASKFISYSYNSVGFSDGKTPSIISIILKEANEGEEINIRMPNDLEFMEKKLNTYSQKYNLSKNYTAVIKNRTVEFGVISQKSGKYKINISSTTGDENFSQVIEFKDF